MEIICLDERNLNNFVSGSVGATPSNSEKSRSCQSSTFLPNLAIPKRTLKNYSYSQLESISRVIQIQENFSLNLLIKTYFSNDRCKHFLRVFRSEKEEETQTTKKVFNKKRRQDCLLSLYCF